jgi:N-hydroxyarylamine O-acetyltransferase
VTTGPDVLPEWLERYLARIGHVGSVDPTVATLHALHEAHASHIPFENIDVLLGRGVDLEPAALQQKIVVDRRGGYCFEHNLLFASVLQELGFEVTCLSARVRLGAVGIRPRTHMLLLVGFAESQWIADVGFGSDGLLLPVPFAPAAESPQGLRTCRVVGEGTWWVMQSGRAGAWIDLYAFTLDANERIDYEVLNHFTATHPRSIFRSLLVAQLLSADRRIKLRNHELTVEAIDGTKTRTLTDADVVEALRDTFGLQLPPDMVLKVPD